MNLCLVKPKKKEFLFVRNEMSTLTIIYDYTDFIFVSFGDYRENKIPVQKENWALLPEYHVSFLPFFLKNILIDKDLKIS